MKNIKFYLIATIMFLFQGCMAPSYTANKPIKQKKIFQSTISAKQKVTVKKAQKKRNFIDIQAIQTVKPAKKLNYTGSIKGIIEKLQFNRKKKAWLYEVKAIDTSNQKLPYAKFYHYKKLANLGDLVYIILNNSQLQNLFFIKKANKIVKKASHIKKRKKVIKKRKNSKHRKIPNIGLPIVEHITF